MAKTKRTVRDEIPREILAELHEKGVDEVKLYVGRATGGSGRTSCGYHLWPINDIASERFEKWLLEQFGGGQYIIDVLDMDTNNYYPGLSPFRVRLHGDPKFTPTQEQKFERAVAQNMQQGKPPPDPRTFLGGPLTADGRSYTGQPFNVKDYWDKTPDQLASDQANKYHMDAQNITQIRERERQEFEKERREMERERREFMQKLNDIQAEHRESMAALERKQADERVELLLKQQSEKKDTDWAALIAAAVPLLTAYFTTSQEREKLQQNQQFRAMEAQQKSTDAMLKLMGSKATSETEALKAIMPMVTKAMNDKSPAAQAQLLDTMGTTMAQNISMIHQIITANAPDNPPPWLPVVEQALNSMMGIANAYTASQRAAAKESIPVPAIASSIQSPPQQMEAPAKALSEQAAAEQIAARCMQREDWPNDMRTLEWMQLLSAIHREHDVNEVADALAGWLDKLEENRKLPESFTDVFTKPDTVLGEWVSKLPIVETNVEYAQQLVTCFTNLVLDASQQSDQETSDESSDYQEESSEEVALKQHPDNNTETGISPGNGSADGLPEEQTPDPVTVSNEVGSETTDKL